MRNRKKIAAVLVILCMLLTLLAPMPAMGAAAKVTITPQTLSNATAGQAYTQTKPFTATGPTGTATFSYVYTNSAYSGLPDGMGFSTTTDEVYGTPTEAGSFSFEIDATIGTVTGAVYPTLTVKAPTIKIAGTLAAVSEDVYYNTTSTAPTIPTANQISATESTWTSTGNSGPGITFSEIGALPLGANFSTAGAVYGQVHETGSFPFTVIATDNNGFTASKSYILAVKAPSITITTTLPTFSAGVAYTVSTGGKITAKETNGTIASCTVTGLPDGLAQSGSGAGPWYISGEPTAGGVYPLLITATDTNGFAFAKSATLTVKAPNITITATLPTATGGANYTATKAPGFTAKDSGNKNASFEYEVTGLPAGLSVSNEDTGAVAGTPTVAGSFPVQVVATEVYGGDNVLAKAYGTFSLTVKAPTITLTLTSGSLTLHPGSASATFTAAEKTYTGSTLNFTYTEAGKLPAGVSLSGGTISGTYAAKLAGSYPIVICATDNNGFTFTKSFTLTAKSS